MKSEYELDKEIKQVQKEIISLYTELTKKIAVLKQLKEQTTKNEPPPYLSNNKYLCK